MTETTDWQRGFPPCGGMYLVYLSDGEQIVTYWFDGGERHDGERVRPGWNCLKGWSGRVIAWAHLKPAPAWAAEEGAYVR